MLSIKQIQEQAHATACEKGWHVKPLRDIWTREMHHDRVLRALALIHSELGEAYEAAQVGQLQLHRAPSGKPEGFVVELADAVIRACDTCGGLDLVLANAPTFERDGEVWHEVSTGPLQPSSTGLLEQLLLARAHVDHATEAVRVNDWPAFVEHLARLCTRLAGTCRGLGLDLAAAIAVKLEYNKTRPHRHGGKHA